MQNNLTKFNSLSKFFECIVTGFLSFLLGWHTIDPSTYMMLPDFSADEDKDFDQKQSLMNLLSLEESLETTQGVCQEGPVTLTLLRNAISVAADFDSLEVKSREPEVHTTGSNYISAHPVNSSIPLQSSSVFYILQPGSTPRLPSSLPSARTPTFSASSCAPPDAVSASPPASAHFACDTGASNKPHPSSSAVGSVEQPPPLDSRASTSSVDSANAPDHKRATSGGELRGREILAHVFELQKQREQTGFRSTLDPEQLATLRNAFISNPKPSKKARVECSLCIVSISLSFPDLHC